MGLLDNILAGARREVIFYSPVNGKMTEISEVSDATFAQKMLGDGVAIIPSDGKICAPCDATIANMFETGHAFSLETDDGAEVLVHIGFDTVELKGEHFKTLKQTGDKVKKGELLVEANMNAIDSAGYDTTVVLVILNTEDYSGFKKMQGSVSSGDEVLRISKN